MENLNCEVKRFWIIPWVLRVSKQTIYDDYWVCIDKIFTLNITPYIHIGIEIPVKYKPEEEHNCDCCNHECTQKGEEDEAMKMAEDYVFANGENGIYGAYIKYRVAYGEECGKSFEYEEPVIIFLVKDLSVDVPSILNDIPTEKEISSEITTQEDGEK